MSREAPVEVDELPGDAGVAPEVDPYARRGDARHDDETPSESAEPPAASADAAAAPPSDKQSIEVPTSEDAADQWLCCIETAIETGIDRILESFEGKLAYDASKQLQIDRLHEELQQHRTDLAARAARPLVHGTIRLHDDIGKLLSALRGKPAGELSEEKFFTLLEGLQGDVEIVLRQNGVAAYREPGGPFDPRRQRMLRKVTTNDEELAGTVAESVRPGFEQGAEIIEKERVATYEFEPPPSGTPSTASSERSEADASTTEPQEQED